MPGQLGNGLEFDLALLAEVLVKLGVDVVFGHDPVELRVFILRHVFLNSSSFTSAFVVHQLLQAWLVEVVWEHQHPSLPSLTSGEAVPSS